MDRGSDDCADSFSGRAARLAGAMGALVGWRPDEFWRATPTEVAGVLAALAGRAGGAGDGGSTDARGVDGAALARMMEAMPDGG